jgi:alkanesulfonate monooxygenase SsuD/methylene tetrahydromethanopterin reductase-like flavin-dependent oxidoreductase (luciferase family)
VLGSILAPEHLREAAAAGERLGFGQLWMAEDCFTCGGISGAAAVLAATSQIPVGLGIVNAMIRHPALLAMEVATLARIYPERLVPAIGLGLPDWLRQLGVYPPSPVGALGECVRSVRALLAGEELTASGHFHFDRVQLSYPIPVPLHMGVMGPKMLAVSGEIADGTVLSVLASPAYVTWARERIAEGARRAGRTGHHGVSTFALFAVDEDGERARELMRPVLAFFLDTVKHSTLVRALGIADELLELAADGPEALAAAMPDEWLEDLAIAGDPAECARKIELLLAAGSDTVELFPAPPERASELIALAAEKVLPNVGRAPAQAL